MNLSGARIANIPNLGTTTKADASYGMKQELMCLMMDFAITGNARKAGEGMDREKVIKGLQIERECVSRNCDRDCSQCDLVQDRDWLLSIYDDAISLLKEREAVEPTWNRGKPFCGACGLRIHNGKFCSECGKPILWKGR